MGSCSVDVVCTAHIANIIIRRSDSGRRLPRPRQSGSHYSIGEDASAAGGVHTCCTATTPLEWACTWTEKADLRPEPAHLPCRTTDSGTARRPGAEPITEDDRLRKEFVPGNCVLPCPGGDMPQAKVCPLGNGLWEIVCGQSSRLWARIAVWVSASQYSWSWHVAPRRDLGRCRKLLLRTARDMDTFKTREASKTRIC